MYNCNEFCMCIRIEARLKNGTALYRTFTKLILVEHKKFEEGELNG